MTNWHALDSQYIISTYKRLPLVISRGQGNYLYDLEGKAYLDLFGGLAVNLLGHSHPVVMQALREQSERYLHLSNYFVNQPAIELARSLVTHSIPGQVFFANSGAEASEAAIKLIHRWAVQRGEGRQGVVALKGGFHGRTLGALRLTRQPHVYQDFPTPDFPVYEVEPNDLESMRCVLANRPAAVLVEPILGSGGVIDLDLDYLRAVTDMVRSQGALVCVDEIQTGMGRTGTLFAYEQAGITPDMILFAKGVGGGLPLGGVIAGERLANLFRPGDHGTTFAPSPLSAALGNAVLSVVLDPDFLPGVRSRSELLWSRLRELQSQYPAFISALHGRGMMVGIHTSASPETVNGLQQALLADGILVDVTQKTIIRLLPPLTLTEEEIEHAMATLAAHLTAL